MGVLLLLSQERWQKFVSFGFDHIISGSCYLIRQKFKLTSFSIACLEVSCTVWSGFWQFFNGRKKGKLCLGSVRGRRGNHLPGALGLHLLSRKDPRVQSSHSPGEAAAQGQVDLGQCQPWDLEGWRRSLGIYFCVQGPRALHSWGQTCQTEQGPPLHVSLKTCHLPGQRLEARAHRTHIPFCLSPVTHCRESLLASRAWQSFHEHI